MTGDNPDKPEFDGRGSKHRRMHTDLIVGLLSIVIIAAGLSLLLYLFIAYQKADQNIESEADQHLSFLVKSLEAAVWNMETSNVQYIGEAYMASDQVSFLEITTDYGEELFVSRQEESKNLVLREGKLMHGGQFIGTVRLGLSREYFLKELRRLLKISISGLVIIVLAMIVASFFIIRFFVRQPLQMLMDMAKDVSQGKYGHRQQKIRHYEIRRVYDQMASMAGSIEKREASLEEANASLQREILRRKDSEAELRRLRNYLSNIIDSMPSILVAVDAEGRVTQWNNRTEQLTGINSEEAVSRPLYAVFPRLAEKMDEIQAAIRERRVISTPKISSNTGDGARFEDITIFPLIANGVEGAVIRLDDVTEHVRMEEMIIQSEKMLTVGGLAAGMAHEINNPLAGILQTAEVMNNRLNRKLDSPANQKTAAEVGVSLEDIRLFMEARGIFRMIETINSSGRRVAEIVSNMLSFARKSNEGASSHSMAQLLDSTLDLAATDYDLKRDYDFKKIKIIRDYAENLPEVICESSKVQQVLLNIFGNAAQAMKTAEREDPQLIIRVYGDNARGMVCIEIEDNGPGMDEQTRKKVFDPFFTTKPTGKGTGLGMSVSYFIITENHGGEMTVKSSPGAGATFIICLPLKGKGDRGGMYNRK